MTVGTLSAQGLNYSSSLWSCAAGLSQIHGYWKIYIKGTKILNPDNIVGNVGGLVYRYTAGDNVLLVLPAVYFFYMSRLLDLLEQEDMIYESYNRWVDAIKRTAPTNVQVELSKKGKMDLVASQYTITWFQMSSKNLWVRTQRITYCSLDLALQSFKLIMRIMDFVELFTLDPNKISDIIDESVIESGLNIPRCLNKLNKNQNIIMDRLEGKKKAIDCVLKMLGAKKLKGDDIIDMAKTFFKEMEKFLVIWQTGSEAVGDIATTLGKQLVYDLSPQALKKLLRDNGQAPKRIKWTQEDTKTFAYLPPEELITAKTPIKKAKKAEKIALVHDVILTKGKPQAALKIQKHDLCVIKEKQPVEKVKNRGDLPPQELITSAY